MQLVSTFYLAVVDFVYLPSKMSDSAAWRVGSGYKGTQVTRS